MIKIKELKAAAHKAGLKLSVVSATGSLSVLAKKIVELAVEEARKQGSPKLEGKHFIRIRSYIVEDSVDKKLKRVKRAALVKK